MKFTETEIGFLLGSHRIETATGTREVVKKAVDVRELGCPARIFERVLEDRAQRLGSKFVEFRKAQAAAICAEGEATVRMIAHSAFRAAGLTLEEKLIGPNLF